MTVRFTKAMYSEKVPLPDGSERKGIRLPEREHQFDREKTVAFVFADGSQITVEHHKKLPHQIRRAFFNRELELTTKH